MFCMFPDSKSEGKKGATGQSFIWKEITSYRIGTLVSYSKPPLVHKRLIFVNIKDWNVNVRVGTKDRWSKMAKNLST